MTRRPLSKHPFDHTYHEIYAIFDDMQEEYKENAIMHGCDVDEPKKLNKRGIGELMAHFNGQ